MKIAITGANGYVGQALCKHLDQPNNTVLAITRAEFTLGTCQNLVAENPDSDDLRSHLESFDCLIHLASRVHHTRDNKNHLALYRKDNVDLSRRLAAIAADAGVKRFIYISSIKVNGETTSRPFREDDIPAPVDAYGVSKYETEIALTEVLKDSNTELVIIRPPLVWGGKPKGNLQTLTALIDKGIPLPFKNIDNRRDIISLPNLCRVIEKAITHPNAPNKIFLVSDGRPRSTGEIMQLMEIHTSRKAILISLPPIFFKLLGGLPFFKNILSKLIGDLEIDISHTRKTLDWHPID
jgi:nucleoside-diphosphate-sugar epimerase